MAYLLTCKKDKQIFHQVILHLGQVKFFRRLGYEILSISDEYHSRNGEEKLRLQPTDQEKQVQI